MLNLTFYLSLCYFDPHFPVISLTEEDLLFSELSSLFRLHLCVTKSCKRAFTFLLAFPSPWATSQDKLIAHPYRHWALCMVYTGTDSRCCLLYLSVHIPDVLPSVSWLWNPPPLQTVPHTQAVCTIVVSKLLSRPNLSTSYVVCVSLDLNTFIHFSSPLTKIVFSQHQVIAYLYTL